MKYLFDSNVIIELLRGNRKILRRLLQIDYNRSYVSEITVIEVLFGAYLSNNTERELERVKSLLAQFNVVSLIGAEDTFCRIKVALRKKGTPIEDPDIMIAATAISNDMMLISNNTKHFSRIPELSFESWQ